MRKGTSSITKFGRARAQRQALLKSLADSLILNESIETTLPKAKVVARYTEKLITKAKKGKDSLHHRRIVVTGLNTVEAAHKLVDEIAPKMSARNSGYLRVEKTGLRRGDRAQLAKVSFVGDQKTAKKSQKDQVLAKKPEAVDETEKKPEAEQIQQVVKDSESKIQPKKTDQAPKRSGVRGNR